MTQFNNLSNNSRSTTFCSSNCGGLGNRYNDFRYDPFGQQALTSTGQIEEQNDPTWINEHGVWRDWNSTYAVQGQVQFIARKAGNYIWKCKYGVGYSVNCSVRDQTYRQNDYQYRDATYSLLDGHDDTTAWNGTRPFAVTRSVEALDAPVKPLSDTLKINPLDVGKPGLPKLPDPSKVKGESVQSKDKPTEVKTGADQGQKQAATPVKTDTVKTADAKAAKEGKTSSEPQQTVLTLEVAENFNDGQGFEHAIYAVQPLGFSEWCDARSWCQNAKKSVKDFEADQARQTKQATDAAEREADATAKKMNDQVGRLWGWSAPRKLDGPN